MGQAQYQKASVQGLALVYSRRLEEMRNEIACRAVELDSDVLQALESALAEAIEALDESLLGTLPLNEETLKIYGEAP